LIFYTSPKQSRRARVVLAMAVLSLSACSGSGSSLPNASGGALVPQSAGSALAPQGGNNYSSRQAASSTRSATDSYAQTIIGDRPSAYYRLNDPTTMADSSANALNGSYGSGVTVSAVPLRSGGASAVFPGGGYSSSVVGTVPKNPLLQPSGSISIEAWIQEGATNKSSRSISLIAYGGETNYRMLVSPSNRLTFFLRTNDGAATVSSATVLAPGHPYHVLGTYNGQILSVYINGRLDATGAAHGTPMYASPYGLTIGGGQGSKLPSFSGNVSDVAVYSQALAPSQVSAHFAAGVAPTAPSPSPAPSSTPFVPPTANYDATVLGDKALAFFRLNDRGNQLMDSVSGHSLGSYGDAVQLGGNSLASDGGSTAVFPGGPASSSTEALAMPGTQLQPLTAISVEAWFMEPTFQANQYIGLASYGSAAAGWSTYGLHVNRNAIEFDVHPQNGGMSVYGPRLEPGVAYHAVGTYDGSTVSLYLNGQLVASSHTHGQFIYRTNGFAIGGSIGSSTAGFVGSIGDVAVYGYPLSSTQVENHYVVGAATPMTPEKPAVADAFVQSIGIDAHFSQGPYNGSQESTVVRLLTASGIRHIREGMVGSLVPTVQSLAASGIRATYVTDINMSDSAIKSWPNIVGNSFEAYEGPNEPNYLGGNWASRTRSFMQRLNADVKGTPSLSGFPILAPAVSGGETQLGDISALVDYGNIHDYFATYNPGTPGWGNYHPAGVYGSLAYNVNTERSVSGSKPIMATETGYGSTPTGTSSYLDDATAAKYITRTYFVHYNAGVARTFAYEFLDQNTTGLPFTNNGLVDINMRPKPAYKALQAIIADLADPGATSFSATPLSYQLTGNLANVQHTLLQKSDGSYYLALWLEVQSWSRGQASAVPAQTVNVVTQNALSSASVMQLDDTGNATTSALTGMPGHSISVPVRDRISIIRLVP